MENSSERDEWVMSVVARALQCPATERQGYLRNTCGNDSQLYQEVAETIEWEARMGSFLLHPMIAFKHFARAFQVGQVISDRFELIREIGEGGMGVVYEAFDRKRNQRIASSLPRPVFNASFHLSSREPFECAIPMSASSMTFIRRKQNMPRLTF